MEYNTKAFYDQYWTERGDSRNRYRYKVFLSWIQSGSSVLDVGSGDGYLGHLIAQQKQADVTCMDISEVALQKAAAKGLKIHQGSLDQSLPFPDKSFDYVIATEIIEHIIFSEAALKEMARVARCGVLISIPNSAFWRYRWQLLRGRFLKQWLLHPFEHVRFWSVPDFKDTLAGLGLTLEAYRASAGRRYIRDLWPNLFAEQVCYKISPK